MPASIAGLSAESAWVSVGPPLSASSISFGSIACLLPGSVSPQLESSERLLKVVGVPTAEQFERVPETRLAATIVLRSSIAAVAVAAGLKTPTPPPRPPGVAIELMVIVELTILLEVPSRSPAEMPRPTPPPMLAPGFSIELSVIVELTTLRSPNACTPPPRPSVAPPVTLLPAIVVSVMFSVVAGVDSGGAATAPPLRSAVLSRRFKRSRFRVEPIARIAPPSPVRLVGGAVGSKLAEPFRSVKSRIVVVVALARKIRSVPPPSMIVERGPSPRIRVVAPKNSSSPAVKV